MAYPPSPTLSPSHAHAEAYELSSYPHAGPSTTSTPTANAHLRRHSGGSAKKGRPARTLTLHSNDTTANILFSAPLSSGISGLASASTTPKRPGGKRRRTISIQGSPGSPYRNQWANFLDEDPRDAAREREEVVRTEEVHVPDFGHMLGFNPEEEDHYAVASGIRAEWRKRLYLLLEEPRSGREAFFVHIFVTGAILFSVVLTTLSTLPTFHLHPTSIQLLFGLDTTLVVLFTFEYLARCLAHADSPISFWTWFTSFFPLLDLLAILPYYIEVAREEDTSILFRFTILRTFRLLRVFRAFRYQNSMLLTIEVMYVAVQRSKDALGAISFFILLVLVLFSTLIYFAERGTWDANIGAFLDADGDPSLFDSIPQTAWFVLATLSTVGYGDQVPRSFLGKLLTMPLLLFGLLLIALPSFVLGRNFAIVFDAMTAQTAHRQISPELRHSLDETPPSPMPPLPPSLTTTAATPHLQTGPYTQPDDIEAIAGTESDNNDNQPLLPTLSDTPGLLPPQSRPGINRAANSRGGASTSGSVSGSSRNASGSGQGQGQAIGLGVRMFDPAEDPLFSTATPSGQEDARREREREREGLEGRDLTNTKLAKNQLVLLEEIGSLRRVIDRQGEMLATLFKLVEMQSGAKTNHNMLRQAGDTLQTNGTEISESRIPTPAHVDVSLPPIPKSYVESDDPFAIGSDDEKGS